MTSRETQRLDTLASTGLLDAPSTLAFDRLTRLAARLTGAPVALVSLVDERRQFFLSALGLAEPWASRRETPLTHSFCQFVVRDRSPLVVSDAREHPELQDNLAIRDLGVVSYAGIPLVVDDAPLGAFCVIDSKPHEWSEDDLLLLKDLAEAVVTEIELRVALREAQERRDLMHALVEGMGDGVLAISKKGVYLLANQAARSLFPEGAVGKDAPVTAWAERYQAKRLDGTPMTASDGPLVRALQGEATDHLTFSFHNPETPSPMLLEATGRPVRNESGEVVAAVAVFRDVTAATRQASLYTNLFRHSPVGIIISSVDGRFLEANEETSRLLQRPHDQIIGRTSLELGLLDEPIREELRARLRATGSILGEALTIRTSTGEARATVMSVQRVDVEPGYFITTFLDVTERRNAELNLARKHAMLAATLESSKDGLLILDTKLKVLVANSACADMFDVAHDELLGMTRDSIVDHTATLIDGDKEAFRARVSGRGDHDGDYVFARPVRRILRRSAKRIKLPMEDVFLVTWRDVTVERDELAEREQQLLVDSLTGVASRRAAEAALKVEDVRRKRQKTELSVAMFDIDHFKSVNDTHGHAAGDDVLRLVAATLARQARASDLLARWGGEEFLAVLPGPLTGAITFGERARVAIENLDVPHVGRVTVSVGLTVVGEGETPTEAIARADERLYKAKGAGRNRVIS